LKKFFITGDFFMLFSKLLLTSILIASDSQDLGNMDKISKTTQFFWEAKEGPLVCSPSDVKDKKVLVVIHGYNNTFPDAITSVDEVNTYLKKIQSDDHEVFYDLMIGYIWPAYDVFIEYGLAVEHADELKNRVFEHFRMLKNSGAHVDVIAHSLGNRLVLEALKQEDHGDIMIDNFFSMAPAVNVDSIEKNHSFYSSTQRIKNMFVLHSSKDDVLKFVFPIASGHLALGSDVFPELKKIHKNIQFVDCSSFVSGHGDYFPCSSIYKFIEKTLNHQNPSSEIAKKVKLHRDGKTTPI